MKSKIVFGSILAAFLVMSVAYIVPVSVKASENNELQADEKLVQLKTYLKNGIEKLKSLLENGKLKGDGAVLDSDGGPIISIIALILFVIAIICSIPLIITEIMLQAGVKIFEFCIAAIEALQKIFGIGAIASAFVGFILILLKGIKAIVEDLLELLNPADLVDKLVPVP